MMPANKGRSVTLDARRAEPPTPEPPRPVRDAAGRCSLRRPSRLRDLRLHDRPGKSSAPGAGNRSRPAAGSAASAARRFACPRLPLPSLPTGRPCRRRRFPRPACRSPRHPPPGPLLPRLRQGHRRSRRQLSLQCRRAFLLRLPNLHRLHHPPLRAPGFSRACTSLRSKPPLRK